MKNKILSVMSFGCLFLFCSASTNSCGFTPTADIQQSNQQEILLEEGNRQTGMPNIVHFRERKLLKLILEMRDQDGLVTYTYLYNEMQGKLVFLCDSIGYGIPYATEYTSPSRPARNSETYEAGNITIPQADPNGLFSPSNAEGTWIICKDPNSSETKPVYIEPRVVVSPFKLKIG
jgi:hypothetical protein